MYPRVNPLAAREERMARGREERRINGVKLQVFTRALEIADGQLSYDEYGYLQYLCAMGPKRGSVDTQQKLRIGKIFDAACRKNRKAVNSISMEVMPGLREVPQNRIAARDQLSQTKKAKKSSS